MKTELSSLLRTAKKKASTQKVYVALGENHFENNTAKVLTHVLQKIQIKPDGIFWETISQQYIDDGTVKPYSPQDLSLLKELSEIAYLDRYQFLAALSKLAPLMGCSTPKESYFRHFPEKSFASSRSLVDLHKLLHQTRQYHFEFVQSGWALEQLKSVHQYQQDVGDYFNYMQRKCSLSDERLCDGSESMVNTMAVFFQKNFKTHQPGLFIVVAGKAHVMPMYNSMTNE